MKAAAGALVTREWSGLQQWVLPAPDGEVIFNLIAPGARLPLHAHADSQFGFALRGAFDLIGPHAHRGAWRVSPSRAYVLDAGAPHGAFNAGTATVPTIDVKRLAGAPVASRTVDREPDPEPTCVGRFEAGWLSVRWWRLGIGEAVAAEPAGRRGHRIVVSQALDAPSIRALAAPIDLRVGRVPVELIEVVYHP